MAVYLIGAAALGLRIATLRTDGARRWLDLPATATMSRGGATNWRS